MLLRKTYRSLASSKISELRYWPNPVCRDPDHDNILAAAISGKCDSIITGDKDLLVLKQYESIDISASVIF